VVRLWDVQSGQEVLTLNGPGVSSLRFSPDGNRLAGTVGALRVKLWDATPLPTPPEEAGGAAGDVAVPAGDDGGGTGKLRLGG
jgi:WD40 repeat protein